MSNYTIGYLNGTITVTPAAPTITAKNIAKVFGTANIFAGTEFTASNALGVGLGNYT